MTFLIQDNGAGITPEKLEEIDTALSNNENDEGFAYGLFNVDKHIKLYYSIVFAGREPVKRGLIDWKTINSRSRVLLQSLNLNVDVTQTLDNYSVA